ncbi:MAG: choice-of-anchor J domain-containing protein, partial [Muribaculaceae bacterium]|nr:choice-of-anchor J domain-containing protein [Muribaculaceae bacterium]
MWGSSDDDTQPGLSSVDGDNGFMMCSGGAAGDVGALYSGRISLEGLEHPSLAFCYYNFGSDDTSAIQVLVNEGDGFKPLGQPVVAGSGDEYAWNQAVFPLNAYKGKKIELSFRATLSYYKSVAIDNIRIYEQLSHDLSVIAEAPAKAVTGRDCEIKVFVTNEGAVTSGDYSVELYCGDELVTTLDGGALEPAAIGRHTFDMPVSPFAAAGVTGIHAVVVYDADENSANNTSAVVSTCLVNANHPAPLALKAAKDGASGMVNLSWQKPDLTSGPRKATPDNFEAYEPFATWFAGEWTFVDNDKGAVDGPSDFDIPNVTPGQCASFFVMDTTGEDFRNYGFNAHSGNRLLAAVFNAYGVRNDDWAISPELPGHAQAVSLWARSYSSKYPDSFEILYSTTDKETASFVSAARFENIPAAWKEYAAQIPAGARYFAIRYFSCDAFILMVDDVTFAKAGNAAERYEVVGYNVYRDKELAGSVGADVTEFVDGGATRDAHRYHVTALYAAQGESDPSAPVVADLNSLQSPVAGACNITVTGGLGQINIDGAQGLTVRVWSADGWLVAETTGAG